MFSPGAKLGGGPPALVLTAVIVGSLLVAFVAARDHGRPVTTQPAAPTEQEDASGVPQARSYMQLRDGSGRDPSFWKDRVARWNLDVPTEALDKPEVRRLRSRRRAFDGAPPVIPHPIDQRDPSSCDTCHGSGLRFSPTIVAPQRSHAPYRSCTQCHAPMSALTHEADPFVSAFLGSESHPGWRAWQGAPPAIPHTTLMRERCGSCHGVTGLPALRTSHPERAHCRQCHAVESSNE